MIEVKQRSFPWSRIIISAAILSYGFWGYGPSLSNIIDVRSDPKAALHSLFFTMILVLSLGFVIRILNKPNEIRFRLNYDWKTLIASVVGLIYMGLLFPELLTSNFTGDELSYLQNSFSYAQSISRELAQNISWLQKAPYFLTLSIVSAFSAFAIYFIIYKALKSQRKMNTPLIIGFVLLLRLCNDSILHFGSAYPNLYGTFLQSVSFISIFPTLVRSFQWISISYVLIMTYGKYWGSSKFETYTFSIICLPLIGMSSSWTAIEPSIFFVVCAFSVLSLLIKKPENYIVHAVMIVSLFTFLRATCVILMPLIIMITLSEFRKNKKIVKAFLPFAILVPYIIETGYENLISQLNGTRYSDISIFSDSSSPILTLINSIKFQFTPIVLAGVLVLLLIILINSQTRIPIACYLLIVLPIYALMIPNATQGLNKYAIEITIPLILIALSYILNYCIRCSQKSTLVVMFMVSTFVNLNQASIITQIDTRVDRWRQVPLIVNYPIRNDTAYSFLRSLPISKDCYNPGITYGVLPFVLSKYNISQIDSLNRVFNETPSIFKWGSNSVDISRMRANCLIVDNFPIKQDLTKKLISKGWEVIYKSGVSSYGTEVVIWSKVSSRGSEALPSP